MHKNVHKVVSNDGCIGANWNQNSSNVPWKSESLRNDLIDAKEE